MKRPIRKSVSPVSLSLMGVPKGYREFTIDDFKADNENLKVVKDFVEKFLDNIDTNLENGKGIFFAGSNGVGKSMLSCIILREAYRRRYTCRRTTFLEYMNAYTESWYEKNHDERDLLVRDLLDTYKGVELLILEELGKEFDSSTSKKILEDLLRYRDEHNYSTIICTNLSPVDFKEFYGASISSLINGSMTLVKIVSEDKR